MINLLLDKFNRRVSKLKPNKRQRFLHGVYKQLAESHKGKQANGEYRTAIDQYHLESEERVEFVVNVADALNQHGLENHANRLLEQERRTDAYQRWKHTLGELERVCPELREGIELHFHISGVRLDVGGYSRNEPFSASVVLHGTSYGRENNLYEIRPVFGRRGLIQDGYNDEVLGWLNLEEVLSIAQSARSRDRQRYDATLQKVMALF